MKKNSKQQVDFNKWIKDNNVSVSQEGFSLPNGNHQDYSKASAELTKLDFVKDSNIYMGLDDNIANIFFANSKGESFYNTPVSIAKGDEFIRDFNKMVIVKHFIENPNLYSGDSRGNLYLKNENDSSNIEIRDNIIIVKGDDFTRTLPSDDVEILNF